MKSSKYSVRQSAVTITALCLITEASFGEVDCQNGLDYKNSCNPYEIKFIKVPKTLKPKDSSYDLVSKTPKVKHQTISYLDALLRRYSANYKGEYGLQSIIDRSGYKTLKLLKDVNNTQDDEVVTTKDNNKDKKIALVNKKEQIKDNTANVEFESSKKEQNKAQSQITNLENRELNSTKLLTNVSIAKDEIKKPKEIQKDLKEPNSLKVAVVTTKEPKKPKEKEKKYKLYTIKKGDSLIKIAKKFGIKLKELKSLNSLDKNNTIKIGQKLKLPLEIKLAQKDTTKNKSLKKEQIKNSNKDYYIVKKGDTLYSIANKNNISITTLREINRLSRSSRIKVGEKIYLKPTKFAKREARSFDFAKNIKFRKVPALKYSKKIRVIATAYTSHRNQTDKTPFLAAWNNRIRPGMKIIAVSHDLIKKYGLTNGVKVKIMGLPGYYTVRDKMNKRLRNHIDIYMGVNKRKALRWGRRRIVLYKVN